MVIGKIAIIRAPRSPATFADMKTRDLKLSELTGRPFVYRPMVAASLVVPPLSTYPDDVMTTATSAGATAKNERGRAVNERGHQPAEQHPPAG